MSNRIHPLSLDLYGTRLTRKKRWHKPDSIYSNVVVSALLTLFYVAVDFAITYGIWNTLQTENFFFVALISFASAMSLDVPPAIAAYCLKERKQKLRDHHSTKTIFMVTCILFVIAFSFSLWLRVATREDIFNISSQTTMLNTANVENDNTMSNHEKYVVLIASLYNGILLLCTSLSSFVINYFSANPLAIKLKKADFDLIEIEAHITEVKMAISEAEDIDGIYKAMMDREEGQWKAFVGSCIAHGLKRKHAIRQVIMEQSSPNEITKITQDAFELNNKTLNSNIVWEKLI